MEGLGVAFFATGPGSGLITYIFTTLEFPTHNFDFHTDHVTCVHEFWNLVPRQRTIYDHIF